MEFNINPDTKPKQFDVTALDGNRKGETDLGIYELENNRLRVCFDDQGNRPRDFSHAATKSGTLIVLEKVLEEPEAQSNKSPLPPVG